MNSSLLLAKVIGFYFLVISLLVAVKFKRLQKVVSYFFLQPALIYLGGISTLFLGILLLTVHWVWVVAWPVLITLTGAALVIKGIMLLFFPESLERIYAQTVPSSVWGLAAIIYLVIAVILLYFGFSDTSLS